MTEESETTATPVTENKVDEKAKRPRNNNYTAFDIELIVAAKGTHPVTLYFTHEVVIGPEVETGSGELVSFLSISGTVLIVDRYFVKLSVDLGNDSGNTGIWIAKTMIAAAFVDIPARRRDTK